MRSLLAPSLCRAAPQHPVCHTARAPRFHDLHPGAGLSQAGLSWAEPGWAGQSQAVLSWAEPGQAGLGWAELG